MFSMVVFQAQVAVKGDLRLSGEFEQSAYHFSATPEGFNLAFEVEADSSENARSLVDSKVRLLLDSLTFVKGPSLRYHLTRMSQKTTDERGKLVLRTEVSMAGTLTWFSRLIKLRSRLP